VNFDDSIIYLVDDDRAVLKAISRLLRASGFTVATCSSPRAFLERPRNEGLATCLVLDLAMPGLSGLELQQMLADAGEKLPIIFLSGQGDVTASVTAMKRGASDFLTKPVSQEALLSAVRAALTRDRAMRMVEREVGEIRKRLETLTPREYEVFHHVISGRLNKQTAIDIGAAEKTVKVHRARVMYKMQVESVAELVRLADRVGIVPLNNDQIDNFRPLDEAKYQ
jgi:FixJ family two-component response regulator